jgi:hypothetical protein
VFDIVTRTTRLCWFPVGGLPNKSSLVPILKSVASELTPFVTAFFSRSLTAGRFPGTFKAFIMPIIKKPGLNSADVRSYRPMLNLYVVAKLLKRVVARQRVHCVQSSSPLPRSESEFRSGHSTETTVLRVLCDLLLAIGSGDYTALVLLLDLLTRDLRGKT